MLRSSLPTRLLGCCMCALACAPAAFAAHPTKAHRAPKQVKQQIADLEDQWRNATLTADIPLMDRLLSDDFVGISWTGMVNTKASQLARLREHTLVLRRMDLSDVKVKLVGAIAIVTSRAEVEGTTDGTPMNGVFRYTRVYQRLPSGIWKITNFEATRAPAHPRDQGFPPAAPPTP